MVAIPNSLRDFHWSRRKAIATCFGIGRYNAVPTASYWTKQIIGLGIATFAFLWYFHRYRRIIKEGPDLYFQVLLLFSF